MTLEVVVRSSQSVTPCPANWFAGESNRLFIGASVLQADTLGMTLAVALAKPETPKPNPVRSGAPVSS
jgi:hypothetical protein